MTRFLPSRVLRGVLLASMITALPAAAQVIGYVPTKDAEVTGAQDVLEGHAVLVGSAAVTAKDHIAQIQLGRGGAIEVCQTSVLHLTESRSAPVDPQLAAPLLLSLDRGAVEVQMRATPTDALMTPDLRLAVTAAGPLDLRVRVAQNGDTCVENHGSAAPSLNISDPFGDGTYLLKAGQHVLFEHGNVHEVVDNEPEPCGCPARPGVSIAEALLAPGAGPAARQATAQHPFPAAQSEGLAPAPAVPQAPPGEVHAQVTENLSYNGAAATQNPTPAVASPAPPSAPIAPAPKPHRGVFGSIGHFFHKIFTGS